MFISFSQSLSETAGTRVELTLYRWIEEGKEEKGVGLAGGLVAGGMVAGRVVAAQVGKLLEKTDVQR